MINIFKKLSKNSFYSLRIGPTNSMLVKESLVPNYDKPVEGFILGFLQSVVQTAKYGYTNCLIKCPSYGS